MNPTEKLIAAASSLSAANPAFGKAEGWIVALLLDGEVRALDRERDASGTEPKGVSDSQVRLS